ncbi:MAG: hypothetical protein JO153_10380 [Solirubrobacterales bacterium]|nr:hypothetical protein [Solirubrobacterales bacterium]
MCGSSSGSKSEARPTIAVAAAIPDRLGFHQERVIPNAEQLPYRIVDHVVYVLLSDQWQRR